MYQIEKGIPLPEAKTSNRSGIANVVRQLEVGDSFMVPTGGDKSRNTSVRSQVNLTAKRIGFKVTTRSVEGGVRVWRV